MFDRAHAELVHGHLMQAEEMAAAGRKSFLNKNAQWSYRFCLLQADVLTWQGRSQDVVDVIHEGDRSFSPTGDLAVREQLLLSLAFARLGQQQRSEEELALARIGSQAPQSTMQAEFFRTVGALQNRRGEQAEAIDSFHKSLALARTAGDGFLEAADLSNLGRVAVQTEHIDEALDWFNASAKIAESIHADIIAESVIGNAGWAYYALGDFDRALASFRQAEEQARILGRSDSEILWRQSAGLSLYRLGDNDGARTNYELALKEAQQTHDNARIAEAQTSLGLLLLQTGQLDAAKAYAEEALRGEQQLGDAARTLDAAMLQAFVLARGPSFSDAEQALHHLYGSATKLPSVRWLVENAYAGLYSRNKKPQQAEMWFRRSIQTFETQRASVQDEESRLPFFANGDELYRDYAAFLIAAGRSEQALSLLDGARARTLEEGLGSVPASNPFSASVEPRRVAGKSNGTILFYSLGPARSYVWAIDSAHTRLFSLPSEGEIATHIKKYQMSILKSSDPLREQNADSQWLYQALVAPTEDAGNKPARIFLVRSGGLNSLNFETLIKTGSQGLHYWIDDVQITSVSSIRLLDRTVSRSHASEDFSRQKAKMLLIGNPLQASSEYPALTNAASEVESIDKYFPVESRTTLTQVDAIPAAYKDSHPEKYSYIHFVAHGTASILRPLDSAIVLSAPSSQSDSFKLYARDIVHQPIAADLVTISACYSSGVRDYAGEGLVGLSWAFLRAGAHNVIGATWAVDDASTAQLMDRLYQQLTAGSSPAEALRQAKLSSLHSESIYRKPFYWAGFQLYAGS